MTHILHGARMRRWLHQLCESAWLRCDNSIAFIVSCAILLCLLCAHILLSYFPLLLFSVFRCIMPHPVHGPISRFEQKRFCGAFNPIHSWDGWGLLECHYQYQIDSYCHFNCIACRDNRKQISNYNFSPISASNESLNLDADRADRWASSNAVRR